MSALIVVAIVTEQGVNMGDHGVNGGARKMRRAIDIYARCMDAGEWPGDDDEPGDAEPIMPRPYYLESLDEEEMVI